MNYELDQPMNTKMTGEIRDIPYTNMNRSHGSLENCACTIPLYDMFRLTSLGLRSPFPKPHANRGTAENIIS